MEFVFLCIIVGLVYGFVHFYFFSNKAEEVELPEKGELLKMKKGELEEFARKYGVELDRRKTKANMVEDFINKLQ